MRVRRAFLLLAFALALWSAVLAHEALPASAPSAAPQKKWILIELDLKRLTLYQGTTVLKRYPIASGAWSTPSPIGVFTVIGRFKTEMSGFGTRFAASRRADAVADGCYAFLKETKKAFAGMPAELAQEPNCWAQLFGQMTADYEAETQKKRTAGLLDKPALEARLQTAKTLRGWEKTLLRAAAPDADTAFKVLREQFGTLSEARDTAQQRASAALEAAFDFMEQAFAESQEMVVFVTELTLSPAAHAFIAENGCERYFQYNKDLLLDHRKAALNQELEAEQRRHGML